ncbi:MAG TPA: TauD/TfdA family dioxygenase [Thermoanaerobaculia bacterium]|nr:TauD/TfdA family dioxygenase [Thermoanaerobaculia bacterium]
MGNMQASDRGGRGPAGVCVANGSEDWTAGVETGFPAGPGRPPLLIRPSAPGLGLAEWASVHGGGLEGELQVHGAILFRGFTVGSIADFERFAESVCPDLYGEYQDLPREKGGNKTYQSTPYPADRTILFHNESSHMHRWPLKQFFHCVVAAREGGETPIVDGREIYRKLAPEIIDEFSAKQLMYVRTFMEGFDVSWQEFFRTEDHEEVERYCRDHGIELEWRPSGLRTRQIAPAVARHAVTGEPVFFNQIQLHHRACLEPDLREALEAVLGDDLPRNVLFGDGTMIPDSVVAEITALYWRCAVVLPWEAGDVFMLDNMLCSHARNPFAGPRKIVVAMGQIIQGREIA